MKALLVDRPILYPGRDIHGGQSGPTIDMCVELPAYGRVYVSASAVKVAARALGFASPERHAATVEDCRKLAALVTRLEGELAEERANKVVSLSEVLDFAKAQGKPTAPAAA